MTSKRAKPITRARLKLRLAMVALDAAIVAGGRVRLGMINIATAWVADATGELRRANADKEYPGASGTARKAPGAASSGAASRRSARAPHMALAE